MTTSLVQNNHAFSGGAASVVTKLTSNTTAGNTIIGAICLPSTANVVSISDNISGRWIQAGSSDSSGGNTEIWYSRGIRSGGASITAVFDSAASVGVNFSEFSGLWYQDPLDQWSQSFGQSASPLAQLCTPRATGDLFYGAVATGASISGPLHGYIDLPVDGIGFGAAYNISASSVASGAAWSSSGASVWAVTGACFVSGQSGLNPLLQFPETLVEISTTNSYQAPLTGTGVWTNISSFVQNMTIGPIGRQHELDRVQAAPAQIVVDNRDGSFNTWNTSSFLYSSGYGLKPMNPVKVTAAWNGITYPEYYGYFQSITPQIIDAQNVDATIACVDIFQMFSLKYLSSDAYAQLVEADGGTSLKAFYRLGDNANQYSVQNTASVSAPGSLFAGLAGEPNFGVMGAFLYDANTALDLTNGSNDANGGFTTNDNTTEPPTTHNPLNGATSWTMELWEQWTGTVLPSPSASVANGTLLRFTTATYPAVELQAGYVVNPTTTGAVVSTNYLWFVETGATSLVNNRFSSVNPLDGDWHHVAISTTPSLSLLYIDGVFAGEGGGGGFFANPTAIRIGAPLNQGLDPSDTVGPIIDAVGFSGTVDEVAFYSQALSAQTIANHYAQGEWFKSIESGAATGGSAAGRLNKVLAVCGLPSTSLVVPYAFRTELYAETNPVTTTSALNYIQTQTETEPGLIFQGPDGLIYAYSREYQYLNPTSVTSQGIFGDSISAAYHYDGTQLQIVQDDLDIFNDVQVQSGRGNAVLQEWGPTQTNVAAMSASVYAPRTLQGLTSLQQEYDSDALALAQNYIAWYANPLARIQQVVTHSYANGGNNLPQMLARGLMDRVTVQYQGQSSGPQFSQDSLIESISHTVAMNSGPSWTTSWQLSPFEILLLPWIFGKTGQDQFGGPQTLTL